MPGVVVKRIVIHAPPPLVEELASRRVDLVALHYPSVGPSAEARANLRASETFDPRAKLDMRAVVRLRELIVRHAPDVVHAFSPKALAVANLAATGLRRPPVLVSFRGISTPPSRLDPANHITFLSPRVRAHACESNAVAAGLVASGIPASRCHTVYNCVQPPDVAASPRREEIRARFGIPAEAFVVGTIAHIRPVKGTDLLLRAGLECRDLRDVFWLVIGEVHDGRVARLSQDPRWEGRLRMAGAIPGAGSLAGAFDLFAMPSRHEGLCRALLEAMSWGVCPVVSDAGGMKELVRHDRDGVVVPRENVPALASAIRGLHADRPRAVGFGASARRRVAEVCAPRAFADRVLAVHDLAAA